MAIAFTCPCGKPMQAREEHAGRKMKCARCGKVVVVPAPAKKKALVGAATGKRNSAPEPARARTPAPRPAAPPPQPAAKPLLARPARRSIPHHDTLQGQHATPWLWADKQRYYDPEPESSNLPMMLAVLFLVLVGAGGLGWIFI